MHAGMDVKEWGQSELQHAQGTRHGEELTWWMLSDLLLKPPMKQVCPAGTSPTAYLPLPLEVFPKYLTKTFH